MVQISSIITALALAVTSVEAGCYGLSNAGWSATLGKDRHEERDHVRNMCRGYNDGSGFHRGALQDTYFKPYGDSPYPATVCVNLSGGRKLIAQVTNTWGSGRTLTPDECNNGLDSEVYSCYYGGQSTKNGWTFRADPELGQC